jgi:hypothetical protein
MVNVVRGAQLSQICIIVLPEGAEGQKGAICRKGQARYPCKVAERGWEADTERNIAEWQSMINREV